MKQAVAGAIVIILGGIMLPGVCVAGEICLEKTGNSSVFYRLNYVRLESVYAVSGILVDDTSEKLSTVGTAFRQNDRSLVISLKTTYPNHYTHPQCTDVLTFAPGDFLTATIEGTCFGSTVAPNTQYALTYTRVPCP